MARKSTKTATARGAGNRARSAARVSDVLAAMDELAPFARAESWDNVGLIAGRAEWSARRILLAIDLTDAVAHEALRTRAELLVVYHPPIFKGIRSITPEADTPTTLLPDLLAARVAIVATHTALDVASPGTNDALLDLLDVVDRRPLRPIIREGRAYKLVVFAPAKEVASLRAALSRAGAGMIGHYHECSFELAGQGTFLGDETTRPAVGEKQRLESVAETRLEMIAPKARIGEIVRALYANHSYEEPAFDLYPLHEVEQRGSVGLGRVGHLRKPQTGEQLVARLRGHFDLSAAQFVGNLRQRFVSVTAAAGSYDTREFRDPKSLVLTGEMKHHAALDLLKRRVTAIALGHYASERPALEWLATRLTRKGFAAKVARADAAPLTALR